MYPHAECLLDTKAPPCSKDTAKYTFDFAQQLPYHYRQAGPIHFETPRKVQLFRVCCDGVPYQVNYLIDEAGTLPS